MKLKCKLHIYTKTKKEKINRINHWVIIARNAFKSMIKLDLKE